ncbi:hypothetical protein T459_29701 [Capsicum annuum]|uniref:Uncharacterized protein n=1 Tax=Capsicum annuum TaxID=4072 RepID=A0A2G2Y677_CAPAN|nr:hypothetical protein T459_29701 [Capsicum annuum]
MLSLQEVWHVQANFWYKEKQANYPETANEEISPDEGQEATPNLLEDTLLPEKSATLEGPSAEPIPLKRSTRVRKGNPRYSNQSGQFAFIFLDPIFNEEAIEKLDWKNAIKEELMAIQRNKTWHLTDLSNGKDIAGLK